MQRLIRNQSTRAYLTADGQWGDFDSAKHFPDVRDVLLVCNKQGITGAVELVLIMGGKPNEDDDIGLKLPAEGLCEKCQKPATLTAPRRTREDHERLGPMVLCTECFSEIFPSTIQERFLSILWP